jgi:hypothetical protein
MPCIFRCMGELGWVGPGNIERTCHAYDRQHLLTRLLTRLLATAPVPLSACRFCLGAGYGLSTRWH